MSASVETLGHPFAPLLQHLECGICLEIQSDMQVVCEGGHSVCAVCRAGLLQSQQPNRHTCPTCRMPMSHERPNTAVNTLVQALGIPPREVEAPPPPPVEPVGVPTGDSPDRLRRRMIAGLSRINRDFRKLETSLSRGTVSYIYYTLRRASLLTHVQSMGGEWRSAVSREPPAMQLHQNIVDAFMLGLQ
mgnify:CR=1 FL=1